ncbi:hypothetical protein [Dyadobacter sp. 3J3]|uniref:hypothetical protein n=1 Tax=Dyadobacter sp. 3J3 TaxID=2606600 RepID=UPI00135CAB3E|nr:hypothetical protein [Dyadobacter sp. 3J3]
MKHPPMGKEGDASLQGLIGSGYFFQFLKTVEILGRLFLLINRYTTFFLLMLLPVTVNIFLFHTILAPSGVPIAVGMLILNVFLCISYFKYYASVFTARPEILGPDKT